MTDSRTSAGIRRAVDVVASAAGLIVLSPAMAVIAMRIKRDSPGPAFFKQTRVGKGGRLFTMYKFRTMHAAQAGAPVTASGDARITTFGRKLRATKLDELPQLANVLVGQMSLVGPRPEVPYFAQLWPVEDRLAILAVRPGITDPVTFQLRHEEALLSATPDPEKYYKDVLLPRKARAYVDYLGSRTLPSDFITVVRTLRALAEARW